MEIPKYDPALAANIISVIAMIVAGMSYRITKKAEASRKDAQLPDVTATAHAVKDQPDWCHVYLTIRNHFPTELYVTDARLRRPRLAVGINERQAHESDATGGRRILAVLPTMLARRTIDIRTQLGPRDTTRHPHGLHPGDRAWISIYVLVPSRASHLMFNVEFSLRETDIRRRDRHVSQQKVMLPTKQTV